MRVAAAAPVLVEKEKPVPRAELVQGERRALLSLGIDPVGDREFGGGLSCDALSHGYTRNSDCGGVHALRPHDHPRGTSGIAVESAGKAMISITTRNAARPAG